MEDGTNVPALEEAGVLILTAAQDFQAAQEYYDAKGNSHGAFTYALLQAMRQSSKRESVQSLFLRTRAYLKALGLKQEPVLLSNEQRRQQPLIMTDNETEEQDASLIVTVVSKIPQGILIEGGPALGIYENTILKPVSRRLLDIPTPPRLKVKQLIGVNRALCSVEQGDEDRIQPGDTWEVMQWAVPERSRLRVRLPTIHLSTEALERQAVAFAARAASAGIKLTTRSDAAFAILYHGEQWQLQNATGHILARAERLEDLDIAAANGKNVFWQLPVPENLADALRKNILNRHMIQAVTDTPADYLLAGFYKAGITYSWLREDIRSEAAPMPASSAEIPVTDASFAKTLGDYLVRLARIKNLLTIENPQEELRLPYQLTLVNAETKQIHRSDTLLEGQVFGLRLELDTAAISSWNGKCAWVYVFVLDAEGSTLLLYPRNGNVENLLPPAGQLPKSIPLGAERLLRVTPPFGTDTYITLFTSEPLPDPFLLQQKGVQSRAVEHPLSDLLLGTSETRYSSMGNWQIYRQVFVSQGK